MRDFNQISIGLFIATSGGILAGALLASFTEQIDLIPGLFILLPGFLELRGNISGTLSSRMSSALHLGKMKPRIKGNKLLADNVLSSAILVLVVSTILGLLAYGFGALAFGIYNFAIIPLSVFAAVISSVIQLPATILFCFYLFKKGYDPDNIMGPYITTLGDVVSVFSILAAIWLVAA